MTRRTDIVSGLVLACLAVILLVWVIPENTSPPQSTGNLAPAFLPSAAAIVMFVLALLLAGVTWFSRSRTDDEPHEEFGAEARGIGLREAGDIVTWCAVAVVMMAGFVTIGFVATAIPALVAMMLYAGERNWIAIGAMAVAVPILLQQIAWHAFTVTLP